MIDSSSLESVKIPLKLGNSPINQAIISICYESNFPDTALFGLLIDVFSENGCRAEEMPLLQIPKQIRENDKNLKYQELYRCIKDVNNNTHYVFGIGSNIIRFIVSGKYESWNSWRNFFEPIIRKIKEKGIIKSVSNISLRYCDVFDKDYISDFNFEVKLFKQLLTEQNLSLNTSFDFKGIKINLKIGNTVFVNGVEKENSSLIDIDCVKTENLNDEEFFKNYQNILEDSHLANKQVFFSLVNEDLLKLLEPEW